MLRSNLVAVGIVVLCLTGALPLDSESAGAPPGPTFRVFHPPEKANDFGLTAVGGGALKLSQLRGNTVLMGFWRKNCQYCAQEKKYLKQLVETLNRPDLRVLMVNLWDSPDWVARYRRNFADEFIFAVGAPGRKTVYNNEVNGRLMGYYILNEAGEAVYEIGGFPSTYVIDKAGRVVAFHEGLAQWSSPSVLAWVKGLLGPAVDGQTRDGVAGTGPANIKPGADLIPAWLHRLILGAGSPRVTN